MSKHNELGKDAEIIAVNFLKKNDYLILEQNYRHGHKEIDIICKDQEILVFVEVKYRSSIKYGWPESFVTTKKQENLKIAATHYLNNFDAPIPCRFDIIAIEPHPLTGELEITHFKDAFF